MLHAPFGSINLSSINNKFTYRSFPQRLRPTNKKKKKEEKKTQRNTSIRFIKP